MSAAALHILDDASAIDAEIFAFWLADLALAQQLGWEAPLPLLATMIAHPSLRNVDTDADRGPSDPRLVDRASRAPMRARRKRLMRWRRLSRHTQKSSDAAPKLRAKKAARVVDLLLADDCVSPARAAKTAGLSDRAARRLFDRLIELGAVRELSGRANFRLYGL